LIVLDSEGSERKAGWPRLSYYQSHAFLENSKEPFFLLQTANKKSGQKTQFVVQIEASRVSQFQRGVVKQFIPNEDGKDLFETFDLLAKLCRKHTKLMDLRLQPYVFGENSLASFQKTASLAGYLPSSPLGIVNTRFVDLHPSIEQISASLSTKVRTKLKIKKPEDCEVRKITDLNAIPYLEGALNAAFARSMDTQVRFQFEPLLLSAQKHPDQVCALGFFLKANPQVPAAFVFGLRHDTVIEYYVAGSISDKQLRVFPFNYILLWELLVWAKSTGAHLLDMGGITSEAEDDPLAGISNFKRRFPGFEGKVGQESVRVLRPVNLFTYQALQKINGWLRR
jgi:hypothetical protein